MSFGVVQIFLLDVPRARRDHWSDCIIRHSTYTTSYTPYILLYIHKYIHSYTNSKTPLCAHSKDIKYVSPILSALFPLWNIYTTLLHMQHNATATTPIFKSMKTLTFILRAFTLALVYTLKIKSSLERINLQLCEHLIHVLKVFITWVDFETVIGQNEYNVGSDMR